MQRPHYALLASFVMVGVLVASVAIAQPAPAASASAVPSASAPAPSGSASAVDAAKEEARAHFERGVAYFDDEEWDAALVEFVRSRAAFPSRAATKDAAICLHKLHRYDEALEMFETLLREFPNLSPEDKALAEREIRVISRFVGRVELRGGENGATVVIEGRTRGTMPLAPIRVSAGMRVVRVVKDGFVPFETQVTVTGEQTTTVDVRLAPLMQGGRLRVVEESGKVANVLVDNVVVGKAPWEGTLPVGDHAVALDGDGNLGTQPVRAPVRLDQITSLTLSLEELDAKLRIEPAPAVATVAIDGVVVGRGLWEGKLRPGAHRIELAAEGFLPGMRDVSLAKGQRQILSLALERDPKAGLTFREAEATRQEWLRRSGGQMTYEVRGQGMILLTPHVDLRNGFVVAGEAAATGPYVSDGTKSSHVFGGGGAGGVGVRAAYMFLRLSDPTVSSTWSALRIGTGFDLNVGYWFTAQSIVTRAPTAHTENHEVATRYQTGDWGPGLMLNVPLTLGYQIGFGTFKGSEWRGVVLGIAYTPSVNLLMPKDFDRTATLSLAAFEVSVDILDRPLMSSGRAPHGKVFAYILPPVGASPLLACVGGGAAWY